MTDYQESVTTGQIDAGQSDPYVPLCFAGDTKTVADYLSTSYSCIILFGTFSGLSKLYLYMLNQNLQQQSKEVFLVLFERVEYV